jgi:hypothetical protein
MFKPTKEQMESLHKNINDLHEIGEYTKYPIVVMDDAYRGEMAQEFAHIIERNNCYSNCFEIMQELIIQRGTHPDDIKYCVGVAKGRSGLPVAHAWLKVDGLYSDPSWDSLPSDAQTYVKDHVYHCMAELNITDVVCITLMNESYAPCPVAVLRHSPQSLNVACTR